MPSKNQQILDPNSDWNQAEETEPICVFRAYSWREVMLAALRIGKGPLYKQLFDLSQEMKSWTDENDIPF